MKQSKKDIMLCEKDALQDLLEQDPMCFRLYPSTKGVKPGNVSFDDRAYCRILAE